MTELDTTWKHVQIAALIEGGELTAAAELLDPGTKAQAARVAREMFASMYVLGMEAGAIQPGQPADFAQIIPYLLTVVRAHKMAQQDPEAVCLKH